MYSHEILNLIMSQNGTLSLSQYLEIYDNTPQLQCVLYDDTSEYQYELWLKDKKESVYFNIKSDIEIERYKRRKKR